MIPAVFVTATGTLYWERSCGSGSAAAAAALGRRYQKSLALTLKEPGGPISIKATVKDGTLTGVTIGGPVRIDASYAFTF
jgi:diaminopimelate epimerase